MISRAKPIQAKTPKWKMILAALGVVYTVAFAVWLACALAKPSAPAGATELAAHPERQEEILAERKAQELQEQLSLSDEQTMKVADILYNYRQKRGVPPGGGPSGMFEAMQVQQNIAEQMRTEIQSLLTDEQRAAFAESPMPGMPPFRRGDRIGPPRGAPPEGGPPGGGPRRGGPERLANMSRQERREFLKNRIQNGGPPGMPPGPPSAGPNAGEQRGGEENAQ